MPLQPFEELSAEELDRMDRLANAATLGPWLSYVADPGADSSFIELGVCNELGSFRSIELIGATAADREFVASAREDLPRLIREVRALRARLRMPTAIEEGLELHPFGDQPDESHGRTSASM